MNSMCPFFRQKAQCDQGQQMTDTSPCGRAWHANITASTGQKEL